MDGCQFGAGRCVHKLPVPNVAIEFVPAGQTAKEKIQRAVAINVAESYATAVFQNTVRGVRPFIERVRKLHSGPRREEQGKARLAGFDRKFRRPHFWLFVRLTW